MDHPPAPPLRTPRASQPPACISSSPSHQQHLPPIVGKTPGVTSPSFPLFASTRSTRYAARQRARRTMPPRRPGGGAISVHGHLPGHHCPLSPRPPRPPPGHPGSVLVDPSATRLVSRVSKITPLPRVSPRKSPSYLKRNRPVHGTMKPLLADSSPAPPNPPAAWMPHTPGVPVTWPTILAPGPDIGCFLEHSPAAPPHLSAPSPCHPLRKPPSPAWALLI